MCQEARFCDLDPGVLAQGVGDALVGAARVAHLASLILLQELPVYYPILFVCDQLNYHVACQQQRDVLDRMVFPLFQELVEGS